MTGVGVGVGVGVTGVGVGVGVTGVGVTGAGVTGAGVAACAWPGGGVAGVAGCGWTGCGWTGAGVTSAGVTGGASAIGPLGGASDDDGGPFFGTGCFVERENDCLNGAGPAASVVGGISGGMAGAAGAIGSSAPVDSDDWPSGSGAPDGGGGGAGSGSMPGRKGAPDEGGRSGDVPPLGISPKGCLADSPYFSLVCRSISSQLIGPAGGVPGEGGAWLGGCACMGGDSAGGARRPAEQAAILVARSAPSRSPATIHLQESNRHEWSLCLFLLRPLLPNAAFRVWNFYVRISFMCFL